jgi:hypothetical protein
MVAGGDGVDPSENSGKDWIVVLLQTGKNICVEFIVMKGGGAPDAVSSSA